MTSDVLIDIQDLHLVLNTSVHRAWTLRDAFVDWIKRGLLPRRKDELHIIKDLNIKIKKGDRLGIIGVNGAGKTSLCRCIAGFYSPTRGKIRTAGKVTAIFDTQLGIVPELTGRENLRLLAHIMFPGKAIDRERLINEAADFSELGQYLDTPFRIYSNGMQTRLTLSLVTSRPSDVLILDEVFDGADVFFRTKMAKRVREQIEASGAVLFVSHSEHQLREVCNRIIVLDKGKMIFDGPVEEALAYYQKCQKFTGILA